MKYSRNPTRWRFMSFGQRLLLIAFLCFSVSGMVLATQILASTWIAALIPQIVWAVLAKVGNISIACGITLLAAGAALTLMPPKVIFIKWLIKRAIFDPTRGNPLQLVEGQRLPATMSSEELKFRLEMTQPPLPQWERGLRPISKILLSLKCTFHRIMAWEY